MKKILFDIDYTLLDTSAMAQNLVAMIAQETGLEAEKIEGYQDRYVSGLSMITFFDFLEFVDSLPVDSVMKSRVKDRYLCDSNIYTTYDNVARVMEELFNAGYRIGIYSEGTPHFQENKLRNLGISHFLDKNLIFITQEKRSKEYLDAIPHSIIVDDNSEVCTIIALHGKHRPIHVKRKDKKFTTESTKDA